MEPLKDRKMYQYLDTKTVAMNWKNRFQCTLPVIKEVRIVRSRLRKETRVLVMTKKKQGSCFDEVVNTGCNAMERPTILVPRCWRSLNLNLDNLNLDSD